MLKYRNKALSHIPKTSKKPANIAGQDVPHTYNRQYGTGKYCRNLQGG